MTTPLTHLHLDVCNSTNDEAWAQLDINGDVVLVTADRQETGRGRQGRSWSSNEVGNLYGSLLLPKPPSVVLSLLPLIAGAAAWEQLGNELTADAHEFLRLKWPNDLEVHDGVSIAKCGGILCESRWHGSVCCGAVIGLGLNVKSAPAVEGRNCACLGDIADGLDTTAFLAHFPEAWARRVMTWVARVASEGPAALLASWGRGARITEKPQWMVRDSASRLRLVRALSVAANGSLLAEDANSGERLTIDQVV